MIFNKLKSLLSYKGLSMSSWARALGITPQSLNGKKEKNQYKISELIQLAALTGTHLAFIDENGKPLITFDIDDIKK